MLPDNVITPPRDAGFSVLEAMIAMALLAAAMLPLLSLQGQFGRTIESIERADIRLETRHVALNLIKTINPQRTQSGKFLHPDAQVTWRANLVSPIRTIYSVDGVATNNLISLYDVTVAIAFKDGTVDEFTVRRVGWR